MADPKPVLNLADVPMKAFGYSGNETYRSETGAVAHRVGVGALGCRVMRVKAGDKAFPFHCHHTNDEIAYVVEGEGTLRFGAETHPIRAGDVLGFPAGGPEHAHQILNTSDADLVYLILSTQNPVEVLEYPDSGKFGIIAGKAALQPGEPGFEFFGTRETGETGYWEGE
jgi:uncharacterized cupin superfamily protein